LYYLQFVLTIKVAICETENRFKEIIDDLNNVASDKKMVIFTGELI